MNKIKKDIGIIIDFVKIPTICEVFLFAGYVCFAGGCFGFVQRGYHWLKHGVWYHESLYDIMLAKNPAWWAAWSEWKGLEIIILNVSKLDLPWLLFLVSYILLNLFNGKRKRNYC